MMLVISSSISVVIGNALLTTIAENDIQMWKICVVLLDQFISFKTTYLS